MKSRLIASIAVGAAVVVGATGCSMISPQGTIGIGDAYSPAGGINVPDHGAPLQVRNAVVVVNDDGTVGNLVAAIANTTGAAHTLNVEVSDAGISDTVSVRPHSIVSLGDGRKPLRLDGIDAPAGSTLQISFQSGDATPVEVEVPVLDGTDDTFRRFVPRPTPAPSDMASATPTATP